MLRTATLGAARAVKRDGDLGSIAPGKLADMILVNGDPLSHILQTSAAVTLTVKDGVMYDPAALWREAGGAAGGVGTMGIDPRRA